MYFIQRHPLEDLLPSQPPEPGADHLTVLLRPTVFSAFATQAESDGLRTLQGVSARSCSPLEWLLISEDLGAQALGRSLNTAGLRWVDQSHAYVVVRLRGPNARAILAKGVGADLHPSVFAVGQSANALCGQVQVNLACVGEDTFELAMMRSYASFAFQDLMLGGKEFALTAAFEGRS
ncbi:sarcosine oxidase subunit gamma family protein [Rhizobium sp.]|uniref:sarcosine oxidase subunit gamma n=1 Tax=Rhizobium sp. TaxID=391 RepID=UPI002AA7D24A